MSVHKDNVQEIEALVQLAEQLGAGSVKLGMVQSSGRGELMIGRNEVLDFDGLMELGKWVESYLQPRVSIPVYYNWPMAFYSLKNLLAVGFSSCRIFNILGILPDGHLAMCGVGAVVPELCYGMLGKDCIADLWTSHPMLIDLRQSLPVGLEGVCGECILRGQCLGSCIAQNYHITRRLTAPFWFCEKAEKQGIFPSSRRRSNHSDLKS